METCRYAFSKALPALAVVNPPMRLPARRLRAGPADPAGVASLVGTGGGGIGGHRRERQATRGWKKREISGDPAKPPMATRTQRYLLDRLFVTSVHTSGGQPSPGRNTNVFPCPVAVVVKTPFAPKSGPTTTTRSTVSNTKALDRMKASLCFINTVGACGGRFLTVCGRFFAIGVCLIGD
jgi:hypothetical protein